LIQKCNKIVILFLSFFFLFTLNNFSQCSTTQVQHEFSLRRHKNEGEKEKIREKKEGEEKRERKRKKEKKEERALEKGKRRGSEGESEDRRRGGGF